ncbi:MAG TPA: DUF262 domain-containing protein, partial [Chitinophagales bacterium]|nr:DUF262 domain-containing protein [Chitinophagales bacterium]
MNSSSNDVTELTIKNLFNGTDHYLIPPYQRNYAWREPEISQLIQDIIDKSKLTDKKNYYIGTLVIYRRSDGKYEVIDGQQRLTTLSLLMMVLRHEKYQVATAEYNLKDNQKLILEFESRKKSTDTLQELYNHGKTDTKCGLEHGYDICNKVLDKSIKESGTDIEKFIKYLLYNVNIIRVIVPRDTDLNHYFETMNNRGEQLEKHEILKARFMSNLTCSEDKSTFAKIWDACANMDRYLQYEFSVKDPNNERSKIFGENWNRFDCADFDNVKQSLSRSENTATGSGNANIDYIINNLTNADKNKDNLASERFSSVVNFPN